MKEIARFLINGYHARQAMIASLTESGYPATVQIKKTDLNGDDYYVVVYQKP